MGLIKNTLLWLWLTIAWPEVADNLVKSKISNITWDTWDKVFKTIANSNKLHASFKWETFKWSYKINDDKCVEYSTTPNEGNFVETVYRLRNWEKYTVLKRSKWIYIDTNSLSSKKCWT